jgi:hypothetical protein
MKRVFTLLTILTLTVATASAQKDSYNPIYTGVNSLNIAPDARGGSLGDVGVATTPDVNSQYWNPAKYPFAISRGGLGISYTPWLRKLVNDMGLAYLAGYCRLGDYQALSGSLRYFTLGDVPVTTSDDGLGSYSIKPYEMAVDVAYSRMLSPRLSASVALRYIYSDLAYKLDEDVSPGSAFAADLSLYYSNYVILAQRECMFSWGINLSNIGTKISYDGGNTSQFLPANMRIGASLLAPIDNYNTISLNVDLNKLMVPTRPTYEQYKEKYGDDMTQSDYAEWIQTEGYNDISSIKGIFKSFSDAPGGLKEELQEIQWSAGLEYCYNERFSLRAGYHHESANKGNRKYFSFGAGFNVSAFSIDAAYLVSTAQSNPLDQTLRISVGMDIDGLKELIGRRK